MPLSSTNPNPRSIPNVQASIGDGQEKFIIADVGARGGVHPFWQPFDDKAVFICFEADEEEAKRVNKLNPAY